MSLSGQTISGASPANRGALRTLLIGAAESATFGFAMGCLVQFWALFVQYGCAARGMPGGGMAMTMYTLAVLMAMETLAGFLGASIVERLERRKGYVVLSGLCTHGAWFFFGFAVLAAPETWFLPLAFLLLVWRGFFDGMLIAPWFDLAARLVPPSDRARFFSARLFASSAGLLLGAAAARLVFASTPEPRWQFAILFWLGGAVSSLGDLARLGYREKATAVNADRRRKSFADDMIDAWQWFRASRYFRRFCLVSVAGALTVCLYPHLVALLATDRIGLSRADYATLTVVLQACTLISCWYLPRLVRHIGWRRTYAFFLALMAAAVCNSGLAALAFPVIGSGPAAGMLAATFVLLGASSAWTPAEANVLYELAGEEKRPSALVMLRAASNGVSIVVAIVLARLGWAGQAQRAPYAPMCLAIAGAVLAACILLLVGIRTRADEAEKQCALGQTGHA